jgi:hypothetical protein
LSELRFYLDENIPTEVAIQLRRSGIDAVSARDQGQLGATDFSHLKRATDLGRVLCTHDQDFLRLAVEGVEHAGIAFSLQATSSIGSWVRALRSLHTRLGPDDARNQVFFLPS